MIGLLGAYLFRSIQVARQQEVPAAEGIGKRPLRDVLLVAAGVVMLVIGAQWLVDGAVTMARILGVSELIIGLTVVAVGTSLPELATSIIAARRGEREIAVGNVVGSNIFNILGVLGLTSAIAPGGVQVPSAALAFDFPVMLAASVACLPILAHKHQLAPWKGMVFLGYYAAYTLYLMLYASRHAALPYYSGLMLWIVIPLTVLTILTILVRELRANGSTGA